MIVFLNGRFVPESEAAVPVFDRAFQYGDGLFETLRVENGKPFRWTQHLERLQTGADYLRIKMPFGADDLRAHAEELVRKNEMPSAVLRIQLSRGVGSRGYSAKDADQPALVMSLHPAPEIYPATPMQWRVITSKVRLPADDPLARFKTCNKLPQILARLEADAANADEALLLSVDDNPIEGAAGNLFWIEDEIVVTPPLSGGILPGVTRAVVLEVCARLDIKTREGMTTPESLRSAQGMFLTLSTLGIVEAIHLDQRDLNQSPIPTQLHAAYQELLRKETQ